MALLELSLGRGRETYTKMTELPDTRAQQRDELKGAPPHCPGVGHFGQVPKLGLAFSLVLLFLPNVPEEGVEVSDSLREIGHMRLILVRVVGFCVADDDIEVHAHLHCGSSVELGEHADAVVARLVRGKGELALGWTAGRGDDMIVSHFADGDVDTHVVLDDKALQSGVPLFGHVVAHHHRVIGQLFQETLGRVGLEVEV